MAPAFAYDVAVMKITVAALMTTPWIARFLAVPAGTDLVLIPGLCEGDPAVIAARAGEGVRVEKGPKDLHQIPEYFGRAAAARDYGADGLEIVAEVNNAARRARAVGGIVPDRPRDRADRLRVLRLARALRRGPPPPPDRAPVHGDRQHHRAHRRGHDRGERLVDRDVRGTRGARRSHHRGDPLGPGRRARSGHRAAPHAP